MRVKDVLDHGTRAASEMASPAANLHDFPRIKKKYDSGRSRDIPIVSLTSYNRPGTTYPLPGVAGAPGDAAEDDVIKNF